MPIDCELIPDFHLAEAESIDYYSRFSALHHSTETSIVASVSTFKPG